VICSQKVLILKFKASLLEGKWGLVSVRPYLVQHTATTPAARKTLQATAREYPLSEAGSFTSHSAFARCFVTPQRYRSGSPSYWRSLSLQKVDERSTNHRLSGLLVRGRGSVQGCHASDVTKLPLVRQPVGQLAHFRLGQVHQQLCEIQLGIDLVPPASAG